MKHIKLFMKEMDNKISEAENQIKVLSGQIFEQKKQMKVKEEKM